MAFWHKEQSPYPGNWMNQPIGFSRLIGICDEEKSRHLAEQRNKK